MRNIFRSTIIISYASPVLVVALMVLTEVFRLSYLSFLFVAALVPLFWSSLIQTCRHCGAKLASRGNFVKAKLGIYYLPLAVADRCPACGKAPFVWE